MKTLLIYNELDLGLKFAILDGDYSRFDGTEINSVEGNGFEDELCDFIYDNEGKYKITFSDDKSLIQNKEWDIVAVATWLP